MSQESTQSPALRKTEYFKTLSKLTNLTSAQPISLKKIIKLYRKGILEGSLNYYRAILKTRNIVYASIQKSMHRIINAHDTDKSKICIYEELYSAELVTDEEILGIFKEFARMYPDEMFTALENPESFLLKLCRLIRTDFSESICAIARTMLESNISCLLEYIDKRQHSKTLKYLIKDIEGMAYLKKHILEHLLCNISTVKALECMFNRIISLYISLSKIDYTLVLLGPVMEYVKNGISLHIKAFGAETSAEALFRIISKRATELIKSVEEAGTGKDKGKLQVPGDVLDFLLSLLPHENMMQALALSISRDYILARSNRQELVSTLENKMGFYRSSNIGIIKKDFEYFSNIEISKSKIYRDVTDSTCIPAEIFSASKKPVINYFAYSEHYWPENNTQGWDDLPVNCLSLSIQKTKNSHTLAHSQITLEYSRKHTYLDITVKINNMSFELSVPIAYVEYLYNPKSIAPEEEPAVKNFWNHINQHAYRELSIL